MQQIIDYLYAQLTNNQFAIAGMLSAAAYGALNLIKKIPKNIFDRIHRLFYCSVQVEQATTLHFYIQMVIYKYHPKRIGIAFFYRPA